jgi:hypothetical protein
MADVIEFHWSTDGSRLYFTTDADRRELEEARRRRYRNGHVLDLENDWSTIDARPFYPKYSLTGGVPRLLVLDIESGDERLATASERKVYERLTQPESTGRPPAARAFVRTRNSGLAWVQADDPARQGWHPPLTVYASRGPDGADPVRCQAPECTGILDMTGPLRDGLAWIPTGGEVLFVRKEGTGYSKRTWYGWRIGEEHARKILTTADWISDCVIIDSRAVCFRQSPDHPGTIVSIDLLDGSIETIVNLNPEFRQLRLVRWLQGQVGISRWCR